MLSQRTARIVARCVLAWFALYLGVAVASPVITPGRYDVICSAEGMFRLVASDDGGGSAQAGASLHCPLCTPVAAPPPPAPALDALPASLPLAYALRSIPAARLAALTAAPLPARGPPLTT
ncbi:MAG: hypothetical protein K8R60_01075 [Burkholderiales bacterium]|nr:hypothetical protein [Burkholderiales bacterium]